ncbi:ABC transporter substrate-binding protein [Peptoniphilus sp.]|uniref:ABC transporter substrate-binding protein n=1 Tax=Peptoniphilus sp. TaxID=1971214 RepID=UPI003D8CEC10
MKNLKKVTISILIIMLAVMTVGCADGGKDEKTSGKKIKIGAIQYIEHVSLDNALKGFEDRLKEEGLDVEIDATNLQGDQALTTTMPKKYEQDEYALVYAISTPVAQGVKQSLPNKNIIFSAVTDPVKSGIVSDRDKTENITGVTDAVSSKEQLESFLKIFPDVKTVGTIYSTSESNSEVQIEELKKSCEELGLELKVTGINNINDIGQAIASLKDEIDVYYAITDNTVASAIPVISETLIQNKIPSLSAEEGQVEKGLLMSEGVNYYEHGRQAAEMAIKVINGEEIKNIPVEDNKVTSRKINEDTAKKLGVEIK